MREGTAPRAPLEPPAEGSAYLGSDETGWEPAGDPGLWLKRLYEDAAAGERTWLMRMDPGTASPPHAHDEFEQLYVIEGSLTDDERTLGPGDFAVRAPGAVHRAHSEEGAVVLLVYGRRAPAGSG